MNELATTQSKTLATQEPSVGLMLQGALASIQSGQITTQHVEVLNGMMSLYERNQDRQDERDFAAALTALQGETSQIAATKKVDEKADGTYRYAFAPYEDIMKAVQPTLTKHGFSITFDTEIGDQRLTSICTLTHASGKKRVNRFAVRYGKPPGSSDAQGDMSTKSYAKRGALCDALNISIDHDTDARVEGAFITQDQADELRDMCDDTKTDRTKFLAHAFAESFETIASARLEDLMETLTNRKAAQRK